MTDEQQGSIRETPRRRRWGRLLLAGLGLAVAGGALYAGLRRDPAPIGAQPLEARVELAAGDVLVDVGRGDRRVVSGAALPAKAAVSTGRGARALIRLPSGATLFLRGDSRVELDKQRVQLVRGEYWLEAPPLERDNLLHAAGDVEVGASDAGLSLRRDADRVVVYVARGTATVSAKKAQKDASAGEQVIVGADGVPQKSAVSFWDDWTGGMADFGVGREIAGAGSGTIYAIDEQAAAGAPVQPLDLAKQAVRAVVRQGLSETEVDQTFFNPSERQVEGWYWFTVPERASVTGFALETNGQLVEGEFIERRDAAARYGAAKESGHSPAILEYVDGRTYRARIYPIPAGGTRRVVLRYLELRPVFEGKVEYVYPMGAGRPVRIGEFSLSVDLGEDGKRMKLSTLEDARVEQGGSLVTMRRSGYTPRAPFQLEAVGSASRAPISVARHAGDAESADYVLARYVPDVDWAKVKPPRADVIVVVDTSAGGDESSYRLRVQTAEAVLRALSDDDRFGLVTVDVRSNIVYPKEALAPASDAEIGKALEALAARPAGGATDLAASFDVALERLHGAEQPAVVYVGDGVATSGEMSAEQLVERLRRSLSSSRARFFAMAAGIDANASLLGALARAGGGESLSVDESDQATARALELTAAIKRPTITDFELDLGAGLDEVFSSATGKVSRGQEVVVLARTHHDLPPRAKVSGRLSGEPFTREYTIETDKSIAAAFVPRLWASEYVRRLLGERKNPDADRGRIVKLGIEYGLMTPFTSVLALESEQAYEQMGIQRRRSPLRGLRLGALDRTSEAEWLYALHGSPAGMAFGCSKESAPEATAVASSAQRADLPEQQAPAPVSPALEQEATADSKEGGYGTAAEPTPPAAAAPHITSGRSGGALGGLKPSSGLPMAARSSSKKARGFGDDGSSTQAPKGKPAARDEAPPAPPAKVSLPLARCSDTSAQPLPLRAPLWWKRLVAAADVGELIERYESAKRACELSDWHAERIFLDLLQRRLTTPSDVERVLTFFAPRADVQKHLAKLILRRSVDKEIVAAVRRELVPGNLDWTEIDLKLQTLKTPEERLAALREVLAQAPNDPNGTIRLVRALLSTGKREEALALGRRLRDEGLFTPELARQLGDVLADAGLSDEAIRTYSEIVEFDADNLLSRRLLGDTYLAHAWYDPAYRQYRVLVDANQDDALGWLRLAAAAAGGGRVDEALRIERRVASGQGTPGTDDPRRWARLLSAARLSRLLGAAGAPDAEARRKQLERELGELQLFSGPASLVLLTWEDFQADLELAAELDGKPQALGEMTDASRVGLSGTLLATVEARKAVFSARRRGVAADKAIALKLQVVDWDGKRFDVRVSDATLPAEQVQIRL